MTSLFIIKNRHLLKDRIDNRSITSSIGFGVKVYSHTTDWYHKNHNTFEDWECKVENGRTKKQPF